MYTVHHDATLLPTDLQTADCPSGSGKLPQLSVSASKDKAGKIHVTLCNLDPNAPAKVTCQIEEGKAGKLSGRVLTAEAMNAHNTFERPDVVKTADFKALQEAGDGFTATLPAKSVVVLEME
jgi:alpha-N-arabinofuranosidase